MGLSRHTEAATDRSADAFAVRAVAWVRVGVTVAIAAGGSIPRDLTARHSLLYVLIGLVWVPWSVVVLLASERYREAWPVVGGPLGDVLALFAVQALAPGMAEAVLPGHLVVIAFAGHTMGRVFAGALAGLAVSLTLLAASIAPPADRLASGVVATFAVAAVAMVFLLERTSTLQARAAARAAQLQSTADAVLDRVADGVVVTDASGVVRTCNPAAERITGRPAGTATGLPCHAVLGLHANERALLCSTGCDLLGVSVVEDSLGHEVWRSAGGRRQPLLANATAVTDGHGEVVEVVHSLRDVTRLKQSEEAKTLFLATASHELKTPLTVIRGFVDTLLLHDVDDNARVLALRAVQRRAAELSEIVDRLLLSSRIEAGRVDLTLTDVPLADVLQERVVAMAGATGRVVDLEIGPEVDAVRGDGDALATVLDHLIDNAVKYSPGGGAVRVAATAGDRVLVTVADSGIGMDGEQVARCFDKFWQAESTDVRRFGGTGIGLYIVRSLVEAMAGRIAVRSEAGEGTTFVVDLAPGGGDDHPSTNGYAAADGARVVGETTSIGEFMRQIGVPEVRGR